MKFTYSIPTKILFGPGSFNDLATTPLPGKKALVVITAGKSMRANGYLDRLIDMLDKQGIGHALFDKILPNPVLRHVHEGAALAREQGCDFVIGLGGGSSIDSAKSIAVMAKNPGDYWDYISGGSGKGQPLVNGALPIVAIATTAGTGTEADPFTVITNGEEKIGGGGEKCFPTISVVDPDFMMSVPPHLTAYQGFDAFFHAAEGYLASTSTPMSDMFALQAIELIGRSLAAAVRDGSNAEARADVALANTLAGFVETLSSCTGEHAIEHALSAFHPDLPHGAGLIMISNAYWKRFAEVAGARMAAIARAMGKADATRPEDFLAALAEMQQACGVDTLRLADYGVREEDCGKIAENAVVTMGGLFRADPRRLESGEIEDIIRESI